MSPCFRLLFYYLYGSWRVGVHDLSRLAVSYLSRLHFFLSEFLLLPLGYTFIHSPLIPYKKNYFSFRSHSSRMYLQLMYICFCLFLSLSPVSSTCSSSVKSPRTSRTVQTLVVQRFLLDRGSNSYGNYPSICLIHFFIKLMLNHE